MLGKRNYQNKNSSKKRSQKPKKEIFVIGDIEMGAGTITDDFISDSTLSTLILSLAKKKGVVDLILNGDTFDFLKCPFSYQGKQLHPTKITEQISLNKLESIYTAHQPVFRALHQFVQDPRHNLYFTIGNHDHDLFFPAVQKRIYQFLKGRHNVFFTLLYEQNKVHVEHGHQYDPLNCIDPENVFTTTPKNTFLNLPEASQGVLSSFISLKTKYHPFLERIKPINVLLSQHKLLNKSIKRRTLIYFTQRMIGYFLRRLINKKTAFPKELVREVFMRVKKQVDCDVKDFVLVFKHQKKRKLAKGNIYVFGHLHERYYEHKGWCIVRADTWRDEYVFDEATRTLIPKTKAYVHIVVSARGDPRVSIKFCPVQRTLLPFAKVLADEFACLKQAAKEEGYRLRL